MNNIKVSILNSGLRLYSKLQITGMDKYNTKEDLLILSLIDEILSESCRYSPLKECVIAKISSLVTYIKDSNPNIMYCRVNLNDYKNLGETVIPNYINCL